MMQNNRFPTTGFSFGIDDELNSNHFESLDSDHHSRSFDASCDTSNSIQPGEVIKIFSPMLKDTEIRHGNQKFNVDYRWNCIPKNTKEIDVVVHFHGYNEADGSTIYRTAELSGLDLSKRTRPTLCIMPLGKSDSSGIKNHSFPFFTSKADGLQQLIDYSLKEFAVCNKLPENFFAKNRLILTAHSGGGAALSGVLAHKKYAVDEVHLFDATYGGEAQVIAWVSDKIKNNPQNGALRVLYRPCRDSNWKYAYDEKLKKEDCHTSETETHARRIDVELNRLIAANSPLLKRYRVEQTNVSHKDIPNTFGGQLLGDASVDLIPTPTKPSGKPTCCPTFPNCVCRGKPTQQSLAFYNRNEIEYFADREATFRNF
jgi:hypothetical protein